MSVDACVCQLTPARSSSGRAADLFSVAQVSLRKFTQFYTSLRQFTPGRWTVSVARTPVYASLRHFTPVFCASLRQFTLVCARAFLLPFYCKKLRQFAGLLRQFTPVCSIVTPIYANLSDCYASLRWFAGLFESGKKIAGLRQSGPDSAKMQQVLPDWQKSKAPRFAIPAAADEARKSRTTAALKQFFEGRTEVTLNLG